MSLQPGSLPITALLLLAPPSVNQPLPVILILPTPYDTRAIYPISRRKRRLSKGKLVARRHTACKRPRQMLNPGMSVHCSDTYKEKMTFLSQRPFRKKYLWERAGPDASENGRSEGHLFDHARPWPRERLVCFLGLFRCVGRAAAKILCDPATRRASRASSASRDLPGAHGSSRVRPLPPGLPLGQREPKPARPTSSSGRRRPVPKPGDKLCSLRFSHLLKST